MRGPSCPQGRASDVRALLPRHGGGPILRLAVPDSLVARVEEFHLTDWIRGGQPSVHRPIEECLQHTQILVNGPVPHFLGPPQLDRFDLAGTHSSEELLGIQRLLPHLEDGFDVAGMRSVLHLGVEAILLQSRSKRHNLGRALVPGAVLDFGLFGGPQAQGFPFAAEALAETGTVWVPNLNEPTALPRIPHRPL